MVTDQSNTQVSCITFGDDMRAVFSLIALTVFLSLAATGRADLVTGVTNDISGGGIDLIADADGNGLTLETTFSGTSPTGSIAFAGWGVGGDNTRVGYEFAATSGFFHTNDFLLRVEATNGTFDSGVGFRKNLGNPSSFLQITSDGVWTLGSPQWTQTGNTISYNPVALLSFQSSDPGNAFIPIITGATYLEFTQAPTSGAFGASTIQDFDLNITSSTVTSVPEPSAIPVLVLGCTAWFAYRRKRRG